VQPFAGLPWSVSADWVMQTRPGVVEIAGLTVRGGDASGPSKVGGVSLSAGQTVVLGSAPPTADGQTVILTVRAEEVNEGGK
jgi:hypothetical protein